MIQNITKKHIKVICQIALSLIIAILVAKTTSNYSLPYSRHYPTFIFCFTISIFILSAFKFFKYFVFIPFFILAIFYAPAGTLYGLPNIGIAIALLDTNISETIEYILDIPLEVYFYMLLIAFFFVFYVKTDFTFKFNKKWANTILIIITLIFFIYTPIPHFFKKLSKTVNRYERLALDFKKSIKEFNLKVTSATPKYKNYVLIIGESMRKDYLSLYGYPINTTPFLNKVKGFVLDGYISAASGTASSLSRSISLSNGLNYFSQNNIISLAKQAGFKTFWISNQGIIGEYDTTVSRYARLSDEVVFLKSGDFSDSDYSDFDLLPYFKKSIREKINKNKFIVLHIMGSHSGFCGRVKNNDIYNLKDKSLSCYLSTITQTDNFIERVYKILQKSDETFSMIYFSDHGLNKNIDGKLRIGSEYKQNYQSPFLRLSSDDTKRIIKKDNISALNFPNIFAYWLGIKSKIIKGFDINNLKEKEVKVFNWSNGRMVDFEKLKDDPAIYNPEK